MSKRFVLVALDVEDWGATEAAAYVRSRDMRGFMGTIEAAEVTCQECDGTGFSLGEARHGDPPCVYCDGRGWELP